MSGVLVAAVLLLLSLILPRDSVQQDYWRPQGRFGKRGEREEPIYVGSLQEDLSPAMSLRQLHNKLSLFEKRFSEDNQVEAVGALCLKQTPLQNYRCFRITGDAGSSVDEAFSG